MPYINQDEAKNYNREYYLRHHQKYNEEALIENFNKLITKGEDLTTTKFNLISIINSSVYCSFYKDKWCGVLKRYNKYNELYKYVLLEYEDFYNSTGNKSVSNFTKQHKYITQNIISYIGANNLKKDCGLNNQYYSKKELEGNLFDVMKKINKVPNTIEFNKNSTISINAYASYFGVNNDKWLEILKYLLSKDEYDDFMKSERILKKEKIQRKIEANGHLYTFSNEELEEEFKRVFDCCFELYNVYPTRRYFNEVSKFNNNTYKKRFEKEWSGIREMYGYPKYNTENVSEKICVDKIRKILNTTIEYQKTWTWLRGCNEGVMHCDAYYPEYNLVVEFDGVTHRKPVLNMGGEKRYKESVINDKLKNEQLKEHNILLLRINSKSNWCNDEFLIKKLREIGINTKILKSA